MTSEYESVYNELQGVTTLVVPHLVVGDITQPDQTLESLVHDSVKEIIVAYIHPNRNGTVENKNVIKEWAEKNGINVIEAKNTSNMETMVKESRELTSHFVFYLNAGDIVINLHNIVQELKDNITMGIKLVDKLAIPDTLISKTGVYDKGFTSKVGSISGFVKRGKAYDHDKRIVTDLTINTFYRGYVSLYHLEDNEMTADILKPYAAAEMTENTDNEKLLWACMLMSDVSPDNRKTWLEKAVDINEKMSGRPRPELYERLISVMMKNSHIGTALYYANAECENPFTLYNDIVDVDVHTVSRFFSAAALSLMNYDRLKNIFPDHAKALVTRGFDFYKMIPEDRQDKQITSKFESIIQPSDSK